MLIIWALSFSSGTTHTFLCFALLAVSHHSEGEQVVKCIEMLICSVGKDPDKQKRPAEKRMENRSNTVQL